MNMIHVIFVASLFCVVVITTTIFFSGAKSSAYHTRQQWERPASVHKVEMTPGAEPEFVIVFIHGFLGFGSFNEFDSWNEFVHKIVPALHGRNYVVYHPGLLQTKDVQSFAQDSDVKQAAFHIQRVIDEIKKDSTESSVGGYSISGLPLLCVGHSNGASTLVSLMSQHPEIAENVDGLLLLSPYADLREASTLARVNKVSSLVAGFGAKLFFAPQYSPSKKTPEMYVKEGLFPHLVPTLFVNNRNDHIVPFKNRHLFALAFDSHHKYEQSVRFLDLDTGGHNWGWRRVKLSCVHCGNGTAHTHGTFDQKMASKVRKYRYYLRSDDREAFQKAINEFLDHKIL